jgi:hypothetical protein
MLGTAHGLRRAYCPSLYGLWGGAAAIVAMARWCRVGGASRLRGDRHGGDVGGDRVARGEQGFDVTLGPGPDRRWSCCTGC